MVDVTPVPQMPKSPANAVARVPARASTGILLVDDHDLVRMGFRALVEAHAASTSAPLEVFEARNLADALALYAANESVVSVVLLDLALPDTQGLSGLAAFRKRFPAARIVVLSGIGGKSLVQGALALGACAFLPKSGDLNEVVRFIREPGLFEGRGSGAGMVPPGDEADGESGGAAQPLTARQLQVVEWVLAGKSNKEIAQLIYLSEGTVKNHVSAILLHYGLRSRSQLISSLR